MAELIAALAAHHTVVDNRRGRLVPLTPNVVRSDFCTEKG